MLLTISAALLTGYGLRTTLTAFPLLDLALFRIRTFRAAVNGGFFTRLGLGGIPFLFPPLLYQVGLGFSPCAVGPARPAAGHRLGRPERDSCRPSWNVWAIAPRWSATPSWWG